MQKEAHESIETYPWKEMIQSADFKKCDEPETWSLNCSNHSVTCVDASSSNSHKVAQKPKFKAQFVVMGYLNVLSISEANLTSARWETLYQDYHPVWKILKYSTSFYF